MPDGVALNLLVFADARDAALAQVQQLGGQVLAEDRSPFGPVFRVRPAAGSLSALAGLPGVQEIEMVHGRAPANDLSRVTIGVAADPITTSNYLNLSGTNILVCVSDTGIDTNHPDLQGRVLADAVTSGQDTNGHGTHVAGIIAGNGSQSGSLSNYISGSITPATNGQFRGMAPAANLFSMWTDPNFGPAFSDTYLQETAASTTNAFISNNSWNYSFLWQYSDVATYDLAAASYDAAVRDALPYTTGPQPMLFVFSAGNGGSGSSDGTGGEPDTIRSPATAKNVITVGALEQARSITNQIGNYGLTNADWQDETDSSQEVAYYSSRGNVGIGVEGQYGRFKPDVVAPGSFVVSTRSGQWDQQAYYKFHYYYHVADIFLDPGQSFVGGFWTVANPVMDDLYPVRIDLRVNNRRSPAPAQFPDLPIFVSESALPLPAFNDLGTNQLNIPSPTYNNTNYLVTVVNVSTQQVAFDLVGDLMYTDTNDDNFTVLSNLNETIGPNYRFESGTSMSAADVSGTLALMQQFLQEHGRTNGVGGLQGRSPALMKAMLINGARSLPDITKYDFQVENGENFQGWGLVQLPTSLHGGLANEAAPTNSMFLVDQDPTNALATGDSETYQVTVADAARGLPLRVTLAWSDPPANPISGVKLVNDLDLVVTNLDTTGPEQLFYFGNDILAQHTANLPYTTNNPPNIDSVNNVENVFIAKPLGTNYSITVKAHRVNVNAVTLIPDKIAQDYALVVSCGDGYLTNAIFNFRKTAVAGTNFALITVISNTYASSSNYYGQTLQHQRVGANPALLGTNTVTLTTNANAQLTIGITNQWNFYVIDNTSSFTNARFVIANPVELAVPRMGTQVLIATNATRPEADVDLYVSTNPGLTNLDPAAINTAWKQVGREGTAVITLNGTNVTQGFYYIAVKSEDQMAADFTLQVLFSLYPFDAANGILGLLAWLDDVPIPDGSFNRPGHNQHHAWADRSVHPGPSHHCLEPRQSREPGRLDGHPDVSRWHLRGSQQPFAGSRNLQDVYL